MKPQWKSSPLLATILIAFTSSGANAADSCAVANISGDTSDCSKLNVEFDLTACGNNGGKVAAAVSCRNNSGTASAEHAGKKFNVALRETGSGWGAKTWKIGKVTTASITVAAASSQVSDAQPVATLPTRAPAAEEATTRFSAFVDTQYQWRNNSAQSAGFLVNDAALYIGHSFGSAEARIDLPFQGNPASNTFALTSAKAQGYFSHRINESFAWKLGQWDTIYGVEVNDTADINLTTQGQVFNRFLPLTHTGLIGTFTAGPVTAQLLMADRFNTGAVQGQNFDYGAQLALQAMSNLKFTAGVLYQKQPAGTWTLMDFILSTSAGAWSADLGLDMIKNPDPATQTTDGTATGIIFQNNYAWDDTCNATLRFEYLSKALPGVDNEMQITVGPQHSVTKALKLKIDYTFNSIGLLTGGDRLKNHGVNLGAVYRFL